MALNYDITEGLFGNVFGSATVPEEKLIDAYRQQRNQQAMNIAQLSPGRGAVAAGSMLAQDLGQNLGNLGTGIRRNLLGIETKGEAEQIVVQGLQKQAAQISQQQGPIKAVEFLEAEYAKAGLTDKATKASLLKQQLIERQSAIETDAEFKRAQAEQMRAKAAGGGGTPKIKTVDLGDRVEYYREGETDPFRTVRKGATPSTQFQADKEATKQEEKRSRQEAAAEAATRHAKSVLNTVSEAKANVGPYTTGVAGIAGVIPGTKARKLQNQLKTIKANLGFDRLQQMREASPTGGALGQVAVQEIEFLQSTVATLDQLESEADIMDALNKIEASYQRWLDAVGGRETAGPARKSDPVEVSRGPARQNEPAERMPVRRFIRDANGNIVPQ